MIGGEKAERARGVGDGRGGGEGIEGNEGKGSEGDWSLKSWRRRKRRR